MRPRWYFGREFCATLSGTGGLEIIAKVTPLNSVWCRGPDATEVQPHTGESISDRTGSEWRWSASLYQDAEDTESDESR